MISWFKRSKYKRPSGRTVGRRFTGGGGVFKKRQYFWQRRIFKIYLIIGILILLFIFYLLFWSGILRIENIKVTGTVNLNPTEIEEIVKSQLEKSRFGLFSQSNLLFFNAKMAENEVKNRYVVESIKIKKRPLKTLKIEVVEKNTQITLVSDKNYYYVDANGLTIKEILVANITLVEGEAEEDQNSAGENLIDLSALNQELPLVYDQSEEEIKIGQKVLEPIVVTFITQLNDKFLPRSDIKIESFIIPERQGTEVRIKTNRGFEIYFDAQDELERQIANLNLVLKEKINDDSKVNYIDLRFGERVYIK